MAQLIKDTLGIVLIGVTLAFLGYAVLTLIGHSAPPNAAVVHADSIVQHADTVFIHDTVRATIARAVARAAVTALAGVVKKDTAAARSVDHVRVVLDTAFTLDSTAIENCARLVQAQRKLIATLQPPPPRLRYFVEPLYSVVDGAIDVRGGAEYRVFGSVSAIAAVQVGPNPGLFVGARITFR